MVAPNATQLEGLNVETLSIWASASTDLTEFVIGNSLALIVAVLLLLSCAKHALMCWEVRQDKRRLHSCYIRHCALLHAAKKPQHDDADGAEKPALTEEKATASVCDCEPAGPSATSDTDKSVPATPPAVSTSTQDAVDAVKTPTSSRQWRPPALGLSQQKADSEALHSRVPSLQLPLTSTSSSDLSFSSSPKSVTSRLLNRLSISPSTVDVLPSAAEGSAKLPPAGGPDFSPRRSGCCPRYSEDEQRRIDEKRQANAQAWMEAKRALESTENLTACMVSPPSSTTRRTIVSDNTAASKEDLS